jgi:hypothetical protein
VSEPDGERHWWVLADPEGNVFCAMPPAPPEWNAAVEVPTPFELVVDCADPAGLAGWWAARFGVEVGSREGRPERWLTGVPDYPFYAWVFAPVPEPKTVKNRMHWDVALAAADPSTLVDAGATVLREPDDDISWWILADPEGNEFCAFPPGPRLTRAQPIGLRWRGGTGCPRVAEAAVDAVGLLDGTSVNSTPRAAIAS